MGGVDFDRSNFSSEIFIRRAKFVELFHIPYGSYMHTDTAQFYILVSSVSHRLGDWNVTDTKFDVETTYKLPC